MVDLLKPKEIPKITPERAGLTLSPQEVQSPQGQEARESEPKREQESRAEPRKEQPHKPRLPSVSQHIRPLEERVETPTTKSERLIDVEKIMSENLEGIYSALPPEVQAAVKYEGEVAAQKIEELIESGKSISKKVLEILRSWLAKIPGVNQFFLEQESKRKTDRIMAIARKSRPDTYVA
ncbi:MAG: hypothetical protein HYT31_00435 [Parcubacteria group bacterium]|nr:hypothetical protein [Parcubacteria group bacterium]